MYFRNEIYIFTAGDEIFDTFMTKKIQFYFLQFKNLITFTSGMISYLHYMYMMTLHNRSLSQH